MSSPSLPAGPSSAGWSDQWRLEHSGPGGGPVWRLVPPPRSAWQRWGRPLVLFVATLGSVFLAGALRIEAVAGHRVLIGVHVAEGLALMLGLMAILFSHEMGHYLACRHYRVDATLPHFIPGLWIPVIGLAFWQPVPFVGTFGAFIRIRAPFPDRKALFDIGVAGPLAGFVVALPVLWLGVVGATVVPFDPSPGALYFGDPLLFQFVARLVHGPLGDDVTLQIGSLGLAAWFGLFVTALNLIPVGQLDGGHVTYAVFRSLAHRISRVGWWVCVALIYFGPSWILWAILLRVLGRRHPPTLNDAEPLGRAREIVAAVSLVVFILCFVPNPIIFSWSDFFEAIGLGHLIGR